MPEARMPLSQSRKEKPVGARRLLNYRRMLVNLYSIPTLTAALMSY